MAAPSSAVTRIRAAHWQAAALLLEKIRDDRQAADVALGHWFREHRQMGGRDRGHVTALVYGVLRDAMRLQRMAGPQPLSCRDWLCMHALSTGLLDHHALHALAGDAADAARTRLQAFDDAALGDAERHNVPESIWRHWQTHYGHEAALLADALNREAPVDLRVNLLKASRERASAVLQDLGLEPTTTPLSPWGLRLPRRAALQSAAPYREGWVEPQDEGSQLLALLVDAKPGERIADFCAGAGGKTLALGAAMQNRGELWALDIAASRLSRIGSRAQRAGLSIVQACVLPDDAWLTTQRGRFDAVLVDAPCSATGTWRRNPELRLRDIDFTALALQQRGILAAAARLVRPGGRLIYATCSLMRDENEAVVADFIARNAGFDVEDASTVINCGDSGPFLRLLPHRHGTDGFFAARMLRRNDT
ncbi:RsmB/NOP family class I SAM-dependent RNA methyltransferase [Solimonas terrae]|uniref:RsmB/NOP family class I SAM-dependent RNA methyltransferase n=1 Tax=Solimonas terrae TaxID=1396819 RepID=A0A6M2BTN8_9GAMM|nr:RsmB/NOP family class I SAM-dependent RNA methyltransferase [Solimonas terrae]NGY06032.1 RsmB/NOP family class I SAM-dependent RNA methyltransferase [Solimonas terrae]